MVKIDNQISPVPASGVNNNGIADTQAKVDQVVVIMRQNVEKILERDQKLSELDHRADALEAGAAGFTTTSGKLKRKQMFENMKMMAIIGVIGIIVLIIIIVWATSG